MKIIIPGYKKCEKDYNFIVEIEEQPINVLKSDLQTRTIEYEEKGIKKKRYEYYYSIKYTHTVSCKLKENDGNIVFEYSIGGKEPSTASLMSYSSIEKASEEYNKEVRRRASAETETFVGNVQGQLFAKFGYSIKNLNFTYYTVKPKKYNYDNFNQATADALYAVQGIDSLNSMVKNVRTKDWTKFDENYLPFVKKLQNAIHLWEEELKESDLENKKSRINKELTLDLY